MDGIKSQLTAIIAGLFVLINAAFPGLLSPEVQGAILGILLAAYGLFMAMKVQRGAKGGK